MVTYYGEAMMVATGNLNIKPTDRVGLRFFRNITGWGWTLMINSDPYRCSAMDYDTLSECIRDYEDTARELGDMPLEAI